ncbi:hypothetical protein [Pelosinus sp. IPA-1]|uniref:hypothetical protein n=1 Tax=Pelosinus sp. IPA-1 TaxID=3029569 RepID=UPI00243617CA|nr:hypothetical protein [Pelosinus sp. IPA-1]GMB01215.1 hypothetical protein PIPA1_40140 [Pelosinus sp. IPA-1]
MGQWEKASCCLNKKIQIIEKIAVNTEAQCRFIHRREMNGLKRTLAERDVLIWKLIAINEELSSDQTWKRMGKLKSIIQDITHKEQEIMDRSRQIIQEAVIERARIAAELRNSKAQRQVKSQYINPWVIMMSGRHINRKG